MFFSIDMQAKNITENSISLVDTVGTTVLSFKTAGERKSTFESDAIIMTLQREQPSKIGSATLSGNDEEGAVAFPSSEVLFGGNGRTLLSVDTQVFSIRSSFCISLGIKGGMTL